jgi:hypothetical protein
VGVAVGACLRVGVGVGVCVAVGVAVGQATIVTSPQSNPCTSNPVSVPESLSTAISKVFFPGMVETFEMKVGFRKLLAGLPDKMSFPIREELDDAQAGSFKQTTASLSARNCSVTDPEPACVQQS